MKKWRVAAVVLLTLVLAGSIACSQAGEQTTWQEARVTRGNIASAVSGSGKLETADDAALSFNLSGRVEEVNVAENDFVRAGQVLASLDTGALKIAVNQAKLAKQQAQMTLEQANAALEEARYNLNQLESRHVSYEQQRIAKLQISAIEQQIITAQMQLVQSDDSISEAEKQLTWAVITAPWDGVVDTVDIKVGDTAAAGVPVMQMLDLSGLELKIDVDEIDIPQVQLGQKVDIEIDALPDLALAGTVSSISNLAKEEAGVVSYEVTITLPAQDGLGLRAGMSATGDIVVEERSNALLVPNRAIVRDENGNAVVIIPAGEAVEARPVITGLNNGLQTEILDGVNEGDTVLIEVRRAGTSSSLFAGQ